MPNVISALGLVKDGEKSVLLNLSNARTVDYDTLEEMTEAQKQGVIICPDYPLDEGNMIPASAISYGNGSAETAISNTQSSITSIFQTGSTATQAISSGTYFYLNGVLVRAKTAIASGATFTLNTNYEVVTAGGLNDLTEQLRSKIAQIGTYSGTLSSRSGDAIVIGISTWERYGIFLFGNGNGTSVEGVIQIEESPTYIGSTSVTMFKNGSPITVYTTKNSDDSITVSGLPTWGVYTVVSPYPIY